MHRKRKFSRHNREQGIIITLVAIFMLGVVGAMAALSIDVTTLYTARSEAQLAADAAALAGARVLANSGMTSTTDTTVAGNAITLATNVAAQVAASSMVGGRLLKSTGKCPSAEICVSIPQGGANFTANPQVQVQVQRTDLPTFFARIWGSTQLAVRASSTAEAYNPSTLAGTATPGPPVEPICVKPWLLPNISPRTGGAIFAASGAISDTTLLGWESPTTNTDRLRNDCNGGFGACTTASAPRVWRYYPGTTTAAPSGSFPAPSATSCTNCTGYTPYQLSIAGCVETPIECNAKVTIDSTGAPTDAETGAAVNTLTHSNTNGGDSVDTAVTSPPFEFLPGTENPIVLSGSLSSTSTMMVSDSLVTVPVIDTTNWPPTATVFPTVQIIGFLQLFLNPDGQATPTFGNTAGHIRTQVINLVGCGDGTGAATGNPISGNGASPVAVRLISQ
jgi:Flp pilus assembly protein TadG